MTFPSRHAVKGIRSDAMLGHRFVGCAYLTIQRQSGISDCCLVHRWLAAGIHRIRVHRQVPQQRCATPTPTNVFLKYMRQ